MEDIGVGMANSVLTGVVPIVGMSRPAAASAQKITGSLEYRFVAAVVCVPGVVSVVVILSEVE